MWTLDYEADIESDLSAFHRVDDPMALDGPRYFSLALRLTAYSGVMAARAEKIRQDEENGPHGGTVPRGAANNERSTLSDDAAIAMLSADGWVEHVTGPEAVDPELEEVR